MEIGFGAPLSELLFVKKLEKEGNIMRDVLEVIYKQGLLSNTFSPKI